MNKYLDVGLTSLMMCGVILIIPFLFFIIVFKIIGFVIKEF